MCLERIYFQKANTKITVECFQAAQSINNERSHHIETSQFICTAN